MHPAAGNWQGTILNALLNYNMELNLLPRAGIIHRLDQDTTGLVIVAKNLLSYNQLILQQKNHEITKIYEAVVFGTLIAGGTINAPIGRHPRNRLKMDVIDNGKPAITHYRILKKFKNHTHIKLQLETGRTHQIRVHMQHINHPIVGDRLYSKFSSTFPRQALHAKELSFKHPITNQDLCFTTSLPLDLQNLLTKL
jgi:23S rRNA pseudouridine1911/1915/1917 synthase